MPRVSEIAEDARSDASPGPVFREETENLGGLAPNPTKGLMAHCPPSLRARPKLLGASIEHGAAAQELPPLSILPGSRD